MSGDRATPRQFDIVASTRRRWSAEQKRAIVREIDVAGDRYQGSRDAMACTHLLFHGAVISGPRRTARRHHR
jgi:transposase-like protein